MAVGLTETPSPPTETPYPCAEMTVGLTETPFPYTETAPLKTETPYPCAENAYEGKILYLHPPKITWQFFAFVGVIPN